MAASDAKPVPTKGVAYRLYFDVRKADGTLVTGWTGADTELSQDGGSFADATNEATEIGTSGVGYVDLTASETNYDCVVVKTTLTNSGALPVVTYLYPAEAADIPVNATAISGDSTAADNLEAAADGTGYNLGGGQVVAASVTGNVGGNVSGSVGSVADYGTLVSDVATAVWAYGTRTLTSFGTLVADIASAVWGATTRTLTSYGTLVTDVATAVWDATTRTLTGFGSLVADIWGYATRALTDKTGFSLSADYDAAKTAAQAGDAMTLTTGERSAIASEVNTTLSAEHGAGSWESGGAGSGARTVTVTVTDGTDPLEGARVRLTRNLESYVLSTDTSGQAVFNLDDGTWQLAVTLAGYQYSGSTITVNGDESVAVVMTAVTLPPASDPSLANCYLYTYDAEGALAGGVAITFRLVAPPTGDARSYPLDTFSAASDTTGLLQVALLRGATYAARRGNKGRWYEFTIDADPYALPAILGYLGA